jgi:hypothetical protein
VKYRAVWGNGEKTWETLDAFVDETSEGEVVCRCLIDFIDSL